MQVRQLLVAFALVSLVAPVLGCGGSDDEVPIDAQASAEDAAGGGEADAAGSGELCGGFAGTTCGEDLYCDYADNHCGSQDGEGICREAPTGCGGIYLPVCGCDGEVYSNECQARANGTDVSADGGCEPPESMFVCGFAFCQLESQYCRVQLSDVVGEPDGFECVSLPAGCGDAPSCACLTDEDCGDRCEEADDGFRLTCPGG
jgi:hypothetical protein